MAIGWVIGLWSVTIIFTIIYFVVLNFTVEKIDECASLMGQLRMMFSGDITQKCRMVGMMGAFAPLVYYGVVIFWILTIIATVAYVIIKIIYSLSSQSTKCGICNCNLTQRELDNKLCNNCGNDWSSLENS